MDDLFFTIAAARSGDLAACGRLGTAIRARTFCPADAAQTPCTRWRRLDRLRNQPAILRASPQSIDSFPLRTRLSRSGHGWC